MLLILRLDMVRRMGLNTLQQLCWQGTWRPDVAELGFLVGEDVDNEKGAEEDGTPPPVDTVG